METNRTCDFPGGPGGRGSRPPIALSGSAHALANSEDPDEMPHKAAFHQGLHYMLRQKNPTGRYTSFCRTFDQQPC